MVQIDFLDRQSSICKKNPQDLQNTVKSGPEPVFGGDSAQGMDHCGTLFLCLCLLTLQNATAETRKELLSYMENMQVSRARSPFFYLRQLHQLEQMLLNTSFPGYNLTLQTPTIQSLAFKLSCNFSGLSLSSATLKRVPQARSQHARGQYAWGQHAMQFPAELTQDACKTRPGELRLICIYFSNAHFFKDENNSSLLNNYVLGAQLSHGHVNNLRDPVNISFWHNQSLEGYTLSCVFWKEGARRQPWGGWSPEGCRTEQPSHSQVLCRCNHLTYFAVLMQFSPALVPAELLAPLTYISLVGCSISIVASLITVLLHFHSRKKSDSLARIHMNLHASVLLLNITFLLSPAFAMSPVPQSACTALAAALHYALLSCLTWMAIEGFNLYLLLGRVYNIYTRRYVLKLGVLGWGAGFGALWYTVSWSWATVASRPFSTWWCWPGRCGPCAGCGCGWTHRMPGPAMTLSPCWASPCCWEPPGPWPSFLLASSCCPSCSSSPS
ncbi:PREDICTED: probable G-protein coupled receptor 114 isoform X5 [Cercocebus atys]|uniref:probable G-protein coupled receptor 114 isoform X5 n=1 Tax=Cercocebus atys TaxID=9531 RepID=UPI0005F3B49D|nr:PREDICTED: probable G-protein coupled receptor 114 isoform X5 [Cercocebus atys]